MNYLIYSGIIFLTISSKLFSSSQEQLESRPEKFDSLLCTSVDLEKFHEKERYASVLLTIGEVTAFFKINKESEKRLQRRLTILKQQHQEAIQWFDELGAEMVSGDTLCHYRVSVAGKEESGYLIMRLDKVKKKIPLQTSEPL